METETLRVLLAGWVAGAAGGFAATAIVTIALTRDGRWRSRLPAVRVGLPTVGIIAANAMLLLWTIVGLVLGAIYLGQSQPGYSIAVTVSLLVLLGLYAFVRRGVSWPTWSLTLVAIAAFAGLLPLLAGWDANA